MLDSATAELRRIGAEAASAIAAAESLEALDELHTRYLGRKGAIAGQMALMKDLPAAVRPALGKVANEVKGAVSDALGARQAALQAARDAARRAADNVDVSLPGRPHWLGVAHPLSQTLRETVDIFLQLGFSVQEGPDIEDEWHNFEALNIPASHPARDAQDTFFVRCSPEADASDNRYVMRTHTSPVQIRYMLAHQPPVRFIAPGRVYRNERIDASHYTIFYQVEGLYVDRGVSFAQLKGTLLAFAHAYYGPDIKLRFRPGYFPFTEPSAEVDVLCTVCGGDGCSVCKQTGWVEILGSGMVHPNVLRAVGYDPDEVSGYAFGLGIDRIAMLKHGIDDIRLLYENDVRFLQQFV
jgi:phenylalanyl-tRNA synthetase alpha chain